MGSGIRVLERNGDVVLHSAIWAGPEEVPVVFIVVKDGATALAHPGYIDGTLYDIDHGDLHLAEAWDYLLIKTPDQKVPQPCTVRLLTGTGGGAEILIGKKVVYRFKGMGE